MPKDVHDSILDSLMREQGYICAYCMSRIPQKHKQPAVTIEHWAPQSQTCTNKTLDYRNMFAVCNGNRGDGGAENMTCDAKRGDTTLSVNPLISSTLKDIQYRSDGTIFSTDPKINKDLNDTLNLNCTKVGLVENRRKALHALQRSLYNKYKGKDITLPCNKLLKKYQSQSKKTPYIGILIWWLKKRVRRSKV